MQPDILQALRAAYPLEPRTKPAEALCRSLRRLSAEEILRLNAELEKRGVTVDQLTGDVTVAN